MSDIGRFGVFLPSYIWEGDGAERSRNIHDAAFAVAGIDARCELLERGRCASS